MIRTVNRERITSGLTNMIREHKQHQHQQASTVRRDRLLGNCYPPGASTSTSSSSSLSTTAHELSEEDVWGSSITTIGGLQDGQVATFSKWRASTRPSEFGISAPMSVPDWSKISSQTISQASEWPADGFDEDDDDEKENWEVARMPPHKLVEREDEARSLRSGVAFSVVEGAGRTLKGWDLRRVRTAVWEQTGFLT